jgi:hypothetical protein
LATQQTQPIWSPSQRTPNLLVARADDVDMLAHAKPLRLAHRWAGAHTKPSDFTGDLLVSPLGDLSEPEA